MNPTEELVPPLPSTQSVHRALQRRSGPHRATTAGFQSSVCSPLSRRTLQWQRLWQKCWWHLLLFCLLSSSHSGRAACAGAEEDSPATPPHHCYLSKWRPPLQPPHLIRDPSPSRAVTGPSSSVGQGPGPPRQPPAHDSLCLGRSGWADSRCVGCTYIWSAPSWLMQPPPPLPPLYYTSAPAALPPGHVCTPHSCIWLSRFSPSLCSLPAPERSLGNSDLLLPLQLSLKCRAP